MKTLVTSFVAAVVFGMTAYAHHSFAGTYNLKTASQDRRKVHSASVPESAFIRQRQGARRNGPMQEWSIEWSGLPQLAGAGITASTI